MELAGYLCHRNNFDEMNSDEIIRCYSVDHLANFVQKKHC